MEGKDDEDDNWRINKYKKRLKTFAKEFDSHVPHGGKNIKKKDKE